MSNKLQDWKRAHRTQLRRSNDRTVLKLLEAKEDGELIEIQYLGGSSPGEKRQILPKEIYSVDGYVGNLYVTAFCASRGEERTFRIDRIQLLPGIVRDQNQRKLRTVKPVSSKPRESQPNKMGPTTPKNTPVTQTQQKPSVQDTKMPEMPDKDSLPNTSKSATVWWILICIIALIVFLTIGGF